MSWNHSPITAQSDMISVSASRAYDYSWYSCYWRKNVPYYNSLYTLEPEIYKGASILLLVFMFITQKLSHILALISQKSQILRRTWILGSGPAHKKAAAQSRRLFMTNFRCLRNILLETNPSQKVMLLTCKILSLG